LNFPAKKGRSPITKVIWVKRANADIVKSLGGREDSATVAENLFKLFREFDEEKVDIIIADRITSTGVGLAVLNRLRRVAGSNIIKA